MFIVDGALDDAVTAIRTEHPTYQVHLLQDGAIVTMDFRTDRVRVFVDAAGNVTKLPRAG